MNPPEPSLRGDRGAEAGPTGPASSRGLGYDEQIAESRRAQRQADRWLIGGSLLIGSALQEAVRLVAGLERRLGIVLFKDFLALHFSQTRPPMEEAGDHPLIVLVTREVEHAQANGEADPDVNPMHTRSFSCWACMRC